MNNKILDYINYLKTIKLPLFDDLPKIELYMDQIIKLINGYILPLSIDPITSSMINNYVKQKIIAPPIKKKYNNCQLAHIIIIAIFKNIFSLDEIKREIALQLNNCNFKTFYNNFIITFSNMLSNPKLTFDISNVNIQKDKDISNNYIIYIICNTIIQKLIIKKTM